MSGSSKGGGGASTMKVFYGTIACRVRSGRVKTLHGIEIDGKWEWLGPLHEADSPNPVVIPIPDRGSIYFYWGLPDQVTPHPRLTAAGGNSAGHNHPAYTNQCYAVFVDFKFGEEHLSANRVRFDVTAVPEQDLVIGLSTELDADEQANPVCVMAELATHDRYGLRQFNSIFRQVSAQEVADYCRANSDDTYISPYLPTQESCKALFQRLAQLFDGFARAEKGTGAVELGYYAKPETVDPAALPLIDGSALGEGDEPDWDPDTKEERETSFLVMFTDRRKNFKKRASQPYDDPEASRRNRLKSPKIVQHLEITRSDQADRFCHRYGYRESLVHARGTLPVRSAFARKYGLRPGMYVRCDIDRTPGGAQLQQVSRILEVEWPRFGSPRLRLEIEPSLVARPFTPEPEAGLPPDPADVPQIVDYRFFESPAVLAGNINYAIGILASRPAPLATEMNVYYDRVAAGVYQLVDLARGYAVRAKFNAAYTDVAAGPFSVLILDSFGREIFDADPGDVAARDDELLMIALKIAGSGQIQADGSNKAYIEVFSCQAFTSGGTNIKNVTALRGRQGTPGRAWAINDEIWFIRRRNLTLIEHADFPALAQAGNNAYFKLQPITPSDERALADCTVRTFTFNLNRDPAIQQQIRKTIYKVSAAAPATPVGNAPAGWVEDPPAPIDGALRWMSQAWFTLDGNIVGVWSSPVYIDGTPGPGLVFAGDYDAAGFYFQTAYRRDAVLYTDGNFYITNNLSKNATNTWGTPGGADWINVGPLLKFVATSLLLTENATVTRVLTFGTAGGNDGIVRSANHVTGSAGLKFDYTGKLEALDADIRGKMSVGSVRYNPARPLKTMPFQARVSADLIDEFGAPITPADVALSPSNTAFTSNSLIFGGWNVGADGLVWSRFGLGDVFLEAWLHGNGDLSAGRMGYAIAYRINGGSWNVVSANNVVQSGTYGNISISVGVPITGLVEGDEIQVAALINKDSGTAGSGIGGLLLSAKIANG